MKGWHDGFIANLTPTKKKCPAINKTVQRKGTKEPFPSKEKGKTELAGKGKGPCRQRTVSSKQKQLAHGSFKYKP